MSYAFIECENKKFFNIASVDEVYDEVHIKLPQFNPKSSLKYAKRITRILKKYKVKNVVLSNELSTNDIVKNVIYEKNNNIIDGNNLYKALIRKMLEDICNIVNVPLQTMKIVIFVHEFSIESINLVKYISKEVKNLIIISENYNRYENIADDLMNKEGITITRHDADYKNKIIANFIINIDFTEQELIKYKLPNDAIIISVDNKIKKLKNTFNGIIINDLDIYYDNVLENFRSLSICESRIYDYRRNYKDNEIKFIKAGYVINGYIGNNGKISEEDFKRVFTKNSKNNS